MKIVYVIFIVALGVIAPAIFLFLFGTVPQIFGIVLPATFVSLLMALGSLAKMPVVFYFNRKHSLNLRNKFVPLSFRTFIRLVIVSIIILFILPLFSHPRLFFDNIIHRRATVFLPGLESFSASFVVFSIGKVFIAPIMEELIYRGIIFKLLKENYSFWISVIISSMLFAGVHFSFADLGFLFFYGILFCWVYEKTKSLWAPIVLHMLINFYSQTTRMQEFSMSPLNSFFYVIMILLSVTLVLYILRFMGENKRSSFL